MNIKDMLEILVMAERQGTEKDEPEGSRFIQISDTMAKKMIKTLEIEVLKEARERNAAY